MAEGLTQQMSDLFETNPDDTDHPSLNELCSDSYRLKMAKYNLLTTGRQGDYGIFEITKIRDQAIEISWDPKRWQEAASREIEAEAQQIDEFLQNYEEEIKKEAQVLKKAEASAVEKRTQKHSHRTNENRPSTPSNTE
jgi:hypothetical protein